MFYSYWTCFSNFANICNWAQLGAQLWRDSHSVFLCKKRCATVLGCFLSLCSYCLRKCRHDYLEAAIALADVPHLLNLHSLGFLPLITGGEHFAINYSALLDAKEVWDGRVLTLPAKLTFRSSSQVCPLQFYFALHNFCKKKKKVSKVVLVCLSNEACM